MKKCKITIIANSNDVMVEELSLEQFFKEIEMLGEQERTIYIENYILHWGLVNGTKIVGFILTDKNDIVQEAINILENELTKLGYWNVIQ